jgi:hypothetical protein
VLKAVKSSVLKRIKENQIQEAAQIVCYLLLCYAVPDKDYNELLKQVQPWAAAVKAVRTL